MAVTNTVILPGVDTFIHDTNFGVNTDVSSGAINHGLGAAPLEITVAQTIAGTVAMDPTVVVTGTTMTLTKSIVAAGATGTFRVTLRRPHSIGR